MQLKATWICPYCEHENTVLTEKARETVVVTCDLESGGCDSTAVLDLYAVVNVMVRPLVDEVAKWEKLEARISADYAEAADAAPQH